MHPGTAIASLAGTCVTVTPYAYALGGALGVLDPPHGAAQQWALAGGCLALAGGSLALDARRKWDQAVMTAGVVAILAALAPALAGSPGLTLAALLLAAAVIFSAWESDFPFQLRSRTSLPTRSQLAATAARAAAMTTLAAGLALLLFFEAPAPFFLAGGLTLAGLFALRWSWLEREVRLFRAAGVALAALAAPPLCMGGAAASAHLLFAAAVLLLIPPPSRRDMAQRVLAPVLQHPAGPLVGSFFLLCCLGALLLHAPAATTVPGGISSIDALFTAVSAVCVTGLIVLDTPNDFTGVGQAIILLLIQLGALGIMSYSAAVIIALGGRLRLREESLIAATLNEADRSRLRFILRRLLVFTFGCEAVGAVLLSALFYGHGDGVGQALWRGVFTSISAFCNAGFALQSDSLIPYQTDAGVLHIVSLLIILGGLSPAAALALPALRGGRIRSAQIQLILAVSAVLLAGNWILFAAFEWNGSLAHLSFWERLHNAWLQSATLRTAGFNSVAFDSLRPATLLVMMASMFIGGSPGGTAGGIKTTTAAVMLLSVSSAIRGGQEVSLFRRRISTATIDRAAAITTLGLLSVFAVTLMVLLTQTMEPMTAVFETVSALATVGLSIGGTGQLDALGKVIITVAMFAGRVGPLSMFAFLSTRETQRSLQRPVEPIDVG